MRCDPLILDANAWQYADANAPPQFPPKRFISGFYATMDALLPDSQKHFKQIPHNTLNPADIIAEMALPCAFGAMIFDAGFVGSSAMSRLDLLSWLLSGLPESIHL